jgi:hypothetical protein
LCGTEIEEFMIIEGAIKIGALLYLYTQTNTFIRNLETNKYEI